MPSLVSIRDVSFSYGQSPALELVSLDIEEGVVMGLIGPNGGGKTTLLKLLLGELKPMSGEIVVAGMSAQAAVRQGNLVGYLPQHGHRVSGLPITIRQVVRLGLTGKAGFLKQPSSEDLAFADEMIERAGLKGMENKPVQTLSGGQLQRAYIARALAPRPRLLLLDEPTTGIDRGSQSRLIELVTSLRKQLGLTVVFVSHDLRTVTSTCDRVACLNATLHYHDVPQSFPEELARGMFCCDLEAMGLGHGYGDGNHANCTHSGHSHAHTPVKLSIGTGVLPSTATAGARPTDVSGMATEGPATALVSGTVR